MLKRGLHIAVSISLVFLLMLNGVSHEFVHLFTGHTDTIDHAYSGHAGDHASFENAHHHCDFLELQAPVFLASFISYHLHTPTLHNDFFVTGTYASLFPELGYTALRGPPVVL